MSKTGRRKKPSNRNSLEEDKKPLKDVEKKLIAELMRNSRRSDRELSKVIGVSQPTVSRIVKRLEKEGLIREFTMIPDFQKLGYELVALTFVKLDKTLTQEEIEKAREATRERLKQTRFPIIMLERGMGLGYDAVLVSLYENYTNYTEHMNMLRTFPFLELAHMESFIISLDEKIRYRPLTLKIVADHLLKMNKAAK